MRACALLAVLLALPAGSGIAALPPGVPGACEGTCPVPGSGITGFLPPVEVVRSGSTVAWQSLDGIGHLNLEDFAGTPADGCFAAAYGSGQDGLVTFRLEGGALVAEQAGAARTCRSAVLQGGSAVLTYYCRFHSLTMRGVLVVEA